ALGGVHLQVAPVAVPGVGGLEAIAVPASAAVAIPAAAPLSGAVLHFRGAIFVGTVGFVLGAVVGLLALPLAPGPVDGVGWRRGPAHQEHADAQRHPFQIRQSSLHLEFPEVRDRSGTWWIDYLNCVFEKQHLTAPYGGWNPHGSVDLYFTVT